jgi:hypothetical protein
MRHRVALNLLNVAAVPTVPKALRQLPGFKPSIRKPLAKFTGA